MNLGSWEDLTELPNGEVAGYRVLTRINVGPDKVATVSFEGYKDEAHYSPEHKLFEDSVQIDFSAFDNGGGLSSAVIEMAKAAIIAKAAAKAAALEAAENNSGG